VCFNEPPGSIENCCAGGRVWQESLREKTACINGGESRRRPLEALQRPQQDPTWSLAGDLRLQPGRLNRSAQQEVSAPQEICLPGAKPRLDREHF
jgi:hypothetical protein